MIRKLQILTGRSRNNCLGVTMDYNFDDIVDRRNTDCLKYDFAREMKASEDALPLWVADMDFQVAPAITRRLRQITEHAIYGYTDAKDDYYEAVSGWYERHFNYRPEKRWIIKTPGVVFALAMAVGAYTDPGDCVLIQEPVYHPFRSVVEDNARIVVSNSLHYENGHYTIDFQDFEEKIKRHHIRLFLLCSPHNPVGRVWTEEELVRMEEICLENGVIVASDEIHSDFIWEDHTHHLLLSLDERYASNAIVCTAPSKSFNVAGLQCSNIFIPDIQLRKRFIHAMNSCGYELLNTCGLAACQAAYEEGEEWLEEAKQYIYKNISYVESFIREQIPRIRVVHPEGTYLLWLDCSELGMSAQERREFLQNKAGIWLNSGEIFGENGESFERLNTACPRKILEKAMQQLKEAVESINFDTCNTSSTDEEA